MTRESTARRIVLGVAIALLVAVPLLPGVLSSGSAIALVRIPVESLIVVLLLALLPWRRVRRVVATLFGVVMVVALLLAGLDAGYEAVLDIPFDPVDYAQLGDAFGVLQDSVGPAVAIALLVAVVVVGIAAAVVLAAAALRVDAAIRRHARRGTTVVTVLTAAWVVAALVGSQLVAGQPAASSSAIGAIGAAVAQASSTLAAEAGLPREIADDAYARTPPSDLLTALRGKDVVIAFIESYGQVAVQGTSFSPGVDEVLRQGETQLASAGYGSRSAWLTSPTFGGISWLAHSTLQTGLFITKQSTYDRVIRSTRFTLSDAFAEAGWKTVSDVPSDQQPWSFGTSFYHYGTLLDTANVGYSGPTFGYARIPDEYTWKHFSDTELSGSHRPVMAEIDLVSSHTPWAPLPHIVPWSQADDGSVYASQPAESEPSSVVWQNPKTVQEFYGQSIEYSLQSMFSFLQNVDDPDLVVIALGDHQPATIVSGQGANHQVPISIIARDPSVFRAISGWRWQEGLLPGATAPSWRMDAFRNRFLTAFARREG